MSASAGSLHVSSLLSTLTTASLGDHRAQAARQLATLDVNRFLANLQAAATTRSPKALKDLTSDMNELQEIFHKLSRAGHDISAAQHDFKALQLFVSQCMKSIVGSSPSKLHRPSAPPPIEREPQQSRPPLLPTSSRPERTHRNSTSLSSTITASSTSSNSAMSKSARVRAPSFSSSKKQVHFATHATVYTFENELAPPPIPPNKPTTGLVPRGISSHTNRPYF